MTEIYDVLQNFISPVTGKIKIPIGYINIGDNNGISYQSPILFDLKQDIIDLRRKLGDLDDVENLPYEKIWIGNNLNQPIARQQILIKNLPLLSEATFPNPFEGLTGEFRIPNPTFDYLSAFDWLMSGPYLPQTFTTKFDDFGYPIGTEATSSLAMTQVRAAQIMKRFDNANFIVATNNVEFEWENPYMNLIPSLIKDLYGLGETYTFTKAQSLGNLEVGLLKNNVDSEIGTLSIAVAGKDYLEIGESVEGMNIAMIRPLVTDEVGSDISKFIKRGTLADVGAATNTAKYILQEPNASLTNAQGLSDIAGLTGGLLKTNHAGVISLALGGSTPLVDDYVTPVNLEAETLERIAEDLALTSLLEGEIAVVAATVVALGTHVEVLDAEVLENANDYTDSKILTLTIIVDNLGFRVTANEDNIVNLDYNISVLTTSINDSNIRITNTENNIFDLDYRVTELEDGGGGGGGGGTLERIINILNHVDIDVDYHPDSLMSNINATSDLIRFTLQKGNPRFIVQANNAEIKLENENYTGFGLKLGYDNNENLLKIRYTDYVGTLIEVAKFGQNSGLNIEKGILNTVTSNPKSIVNKEFAQALITQQLQNISNLSTTGIVVRDNVNSFVTRTNIASTGINIIDGDGVSGNPTFSVSNVPINALSGYPNNSSVFLKGDGTWGATPTIPTKSVLQAYVTDTYATNTAINDYIKYNGFHFGTGSNISLDNYSAYTTALNTNGLGRITLVGNKAYKITTKLLLYNYIQDSKRFCWFDVDAGIELFLGVFINPVSASFSEAYHCFYYQTNQNKRIALKILSSVNNLQICGRNFPSYGLDMGSTSVIVEEV